LEPLKVLLRDYEYVIAVPYALPNIEELPGKYRPFVAMHSLK
jgi:hypothetical protein